MTQTSPATAARRRQNLPGGWCQGTLEHDGESFRYQALVFDVGSPFGIDGGPVSKLAISRGTDFRAAVYNYDRGLDFDRAPVGLVACVMADIGGAA